MRRRLRDGLMVTGAVLLALAALEGAARWLEPADERPAPEAPGPLPKRPGAFRLFAFGASSVYGAPVPRLGYVAQLHFWLRRSLPDRAVEVFNFGLPGASSGQLLDGLRLRIDRQPDAVLLHTGMGEFFLTDAELFSRALLHDASRHSALVRRLRRLAAGAGEPAAGAAAVDAGAFPIYRRDSWAYRRKLRRYRRHVEEMVEAVRAAGAPLLLATIASNLADWPPANRALADRLYEPSFVATLDAIDADLDRGRFAEASARIESALARHPDDALLLFELGRARRGLGDPAAARELFRRARDLDPLPWRPVSAVNDFLRELGERDGVVLVDFERALERSAPDGLVGAELVGDGSHPTPRGSDVLARAILEALAAHGLIPRDAPVFSDPDPLASYLAPLRRTGLREEFRLETALFCLKVPLRHPDVARFHLERLLADRPGSWQGWANLATASFFDGEPERGRRELRRALELQPDAARLRAAAPYLAEALERAGVEWAEARVD